MSQLDPSRTTCGDICTAALQECGRLGTGQTALAEDSNKAWARLQWMLQEWERKRWLVYHLVTFSITSTGASSYSVGPGGSINTNSVAVWDLETLTLSSGGTGHVVNDVITLATNLPASVPSSSITVTVTAVSSGVVTTFTITGTPQYHAPLPGVWTQVSSTGTGINLILNLPTWELDSGRGLGTFPPGGSARPAKLESAFLRQLQLSEPNQVDYPLQVLQSMEDYNRIALKQLTSFPGAVYLDPSWPLAQLYCYPIPQEDIYGIYITIREQLPVQFATLSDVINLPYEYFSAILYNLALRLRPVYQIGTYPGDPLPGLAKAALATLRGANTAIAQLSMPSTLTRPGIYNIYSDQTY